METKFNKNQAGFTMVELIIVIAIIGVLAQIAIQHFARVKVKICNLSAEQQHVFVQTAYEARVAHTLASGENRRIHIYVEGGTSLYNTTLEELLPGYVLAQKPPHVQHTVYERVCPPSKTGYAFYITTLECNAGIRRHIQEHCNGTYEETETYTWNWDDGCSCTS